MTFRARSDEDRARLEAGWPHLIFADSAHPDDKKAETCAKKYLSAIDPIYFTIWPKSVLDRVLRAGAQTTFDDARTPRQVRTKETLAAVVNAEALTKDEAVRLLHDQVLTSDENYEFKTCDCVFGLESIVGADAALEAITSALEAIDWKTGSDEGGGTPLHTYFKKYTADCVGFLLLRAQRPEAVKARLAVVAARAAEEAKKQQSWDWFAESLGISLGGAAAAKALDHPRINLRAVEVAQDDLEFVLDAVLKREPKQGVTVRLVWLVGPAILQGLEKRKFIQKGERAAFMRDLAMLRDDRIAEWVAGHADVLKKAALSWAKADVDYARPFFENAAKKADKNGRAAKEILSELDGKKPKKKK